MLVYESQRAYTTKSGRKVTYKLLEDTERENRGWIVDEVRIYVDGQEAGYMKISYIPKFNLAKFYPKPYSVLAYISQIKGWGYKMLDDVKNKDWVKVARSIHGHVRVPYYPYYFKTNHFKDVTAEEWESVAKRLMQEATDRFKDEFKDFVNYYVDKPLVDFLSVDEKFRGEGLSLVLYLIAADWMKKKGMVLWSSNLKSDLGQAAWNANKKKLPVKSKRFKYLGQTSTREYVNI